MSDTNDKKISMEQIQGTVFSCYRAMIALLLEATPIPWETVTRLGKNVTELDIILKGPINEPAPGKDVESHIAKALIAQLGPLLSVGNERAASEARRARAVELEALVRLQRTMTEAGQKTEKVDEQISALKAQIEKKG